MTDPRDLYQAQLDYDIDQAYASGARNTLAVLPTGGGKSIVMSRRIKRYDQYGYPQCVAAHRNELVTQMAMHVARQGVKHRVIAAKETVADVVRQQRDELGRSFVSPDAPCGVGSVQTILSRKETLKPWIAQVRNFYGDEGHHYVANNMFGDCAGLFVNANGLLVTATPRRADGLGLGRHHDGIVDAMVQGPTQRELIDMGALSDYQIVCPVSDLVVDDEDFAPSGDLSPKKGRAASQKSHIVGDVVYNYMIYAYGKRGLCFATDVETAQEMANNFNAFNIPAAAVSAKTPANVRNDYIRRFKAGQLWMLVNVDLFGEGFDVPAVEVVIMARPTASLAVYLQQFGRALRILAGKPFGLVIDHVSNWKRHGLPDKPHLWSLDRRDKRAKSAPDPENIPPTVCKGCTRAYPRFLAVCPYCGHMPVVAGGGRSVEQVDGDLTLLGFDALAELRKGLALPSAGAVASQAAFVAGPLAGAGAANRQIEKLAAYARLDSAIAQWAGWQRHKGRPDSESYRRFYVATGIDVVSALQQPRADMEKLAAIVEGWL
jgi:DNA repair protein RadD